MQKTITLLLAATLSLAASAQLSKSIKLNEVVTNNVESLQDEYGHRLPWIEIANTSFTTYNIRGMFITTNRDVLNPAMSVPDRMKLMAMIPNGDPRTNLGAKQHLLLFGNSNPARGFQHLAVSFEPGKPTWIALYNGNATELVDSITIPALGPDQSFARRNDGREGWQVKAALSVTPGINNYIQADETKVAKLKRDDPHGIGITVLSMGIVFFCLALLFVFFTLFGMFMRHRAAAKRLAHIRLVSAGVKTVEKTVEIGHKTNVILQDGLKSKGIDKEIYIAVIAMALKQYQENVHDTESGVITIKPKNTDWNDEYIQMTQFHE